jgi:hypothetical protein
VRGMHILDPWGGRAPFTCRSLPFRNSDGRFTTGRGFNGGTRRVLPESKINVKRRVSVFTLALVALETVALFAQVPTTPLLEKPMVTDANPSFEVATIKPTPPGTQGGGLGPDPGGRFTVHNSTLAGLLRFAYGLNRNQLENQPAWLENDRFDIIAKADMAGAPNMAQQRIMMQKLLADRLQSPLSSREKGRHRLRAHSAELRIKAHPEYGGS